MIKTVDSQGGILVDYQHPVKALPQHIFYASVTAPDRARVEVWLNDKMVDCVYVGNGSSHSWWGSANAPLIPGGALRPGDRLQVRAFGECAMRIDDINDKEEG